MKNVGAPHIHRQLLEQGKRKFRVFLFLTRILHSLLSKSFMYVHSPTSLTNDASCGVLFVVRLVDPCRECCDEAQRRLRAEERFRRAWVSQCRRDISLGCSNLFRPCLAPVYRRRSRGVGDVCNGEQVSSHKAQRCWFA